MKSLNLQAFLRDSQAFVGTVNHGDRLNLNINVVLKLKFMLMQEQTRPICFNRPLIYQHILIYNAGQGIVWCVFEHKGDGQDA